MCILIVYADIKLYTFKMFTFNAFNNLKKKHVMII